MRGQVSKQTKKKVGRSRGTILEIVLWPPHTRAHPPTGITHTERERGRKESEADRDRKRQREKRERRRVGKERGERPAKLARRTNRVFQGGMVRARPSGQAETAVIRSQLPAQLCKGTAPGPWGLE